MKKNEKAEFECMECGKKFKKSLKSGKEVSCPKCKGGDIELA